MLEKEVRTFFFSFLLFTFEKDHNLFWVYQNGNFLPGKSISRREKNQEKMTLPPQKNMPVTPLPLGHQRVEMYLGHFSKFRQIHNETKLRIISLTKTRRTSSLKFSVSYAKDTTRDSTVKQLIKP